jgi:hypothetical protein
MEDLTSVDPSYVALVAADPVDAFFDNMPSPEEHHNLSGEEAATMLHRANMIFLALVERGNTSSHMACYELLKDAITKYWMTSRHLRLIYAQLASLTVDKPIGPDDSDSRKARQLRYIHWVVNGRKDATSPFAAVLAEGPSDMKISSTSDHCAACDKVNATMNCGACQIASGDGVAFSTAYCSQDCQKKHWPTHKTVCKEVQQLARAVGMFNDIFHHFLGLTYPEETKLQSITRQGDMVVAKDAGIRVDKVTDTARFPAELAETPALADAVLMFSQCVTTLREARPLVEMLIRRTCLETVLHTLPNQF